MARLVRGAPTRFPALIGVLVVLPFMILEAVNRPDFITNVPVALYVFMWLVATIFLAILLPMVRTGRAGNTLMAHPGLLLLRVVLLVAIAWAWGTVVADQLPCFLGVPNCD